LKKTPGSVKDLAIDFLIYGTLAEIFGREIESIRHGRLMHAFFPPFGIFPNNAIVGGSGDISVGAALYKKINRKPGIIIGNIGDASSACGPVWEGLCLATMDQYKKLWQEPYRGGLPLIMIVNNFYGMGSQTCGETMGYEFGRLGADQSRTDACRTH
jgi:2-oxoisovalerate dehydrogenase E1 component